MNQENGSTSLVPVTSSKANLRLTVERAGDALAIISPHWTVVHDLAAGGVIREMRVRHASNRNLLRLPISARIDEWFERYERAPRVTIEESAGDTITLTVAGCLCDVQGQRGPIEYTHRYTHTPYTTRHDLTLVLREPLLARRLTALDMAVTGALDTYSYGSADYARCKPRYMHIIGAHYDDLWDRLPLSSAPATVQQDAYRPWQVTLFSPGGEGLQWCGDSHEYAWNTVCGADAARFKLACDAEGARLELSPVCRDAPGARVPLEGELTFGWYLTLPTIPALGHRKYNEVVIGTSPFPEDAQLEAWAHRGVNLLRIHQDADYQGQTEDYWHDGIYPPYPAAKMRALDKFIQKCHRLGMIIVPYFCGWILNVLAPAFATHAPDWHVPSRPNGQMRFHPAPGAGTYGAFVCPDSGWGVFLDNYIRRCVDTLGFDGYYLDYGGPGPCYNTRHLPGVHNGIDALTQMLIRHRAWLGSDRLLFIHAGGTSMWLLHHNLADQIVTLEEGRRDGRTPQCIDDYPPYIAYMPATSVTLVPNVYYPPASEPPRERLYRGIAQAALLGALPYTYEPFEKTSWGYTRWAEATDDPQGLYAAFEQFNAYDWSRYRFYNATTGVARASAPACGVALYASEGQAVLVVSNQTDQPLPADRAAIDTDIAQRYRLPTAVDIPALGPYGIQLIKIAA